MDDEGQFSRGCAYRSAFPVGGIMHYEHLADHVDGERERLFRSVTPMTVEALREYVDQEWLFMGNSRLFDGVSRRGRHDMDNARARWIWNRRGSI